MVVLSAALYFLTQHPMLAMLALVIGGLGAGGLLASVRGHRGWFSLIIPFTCSVRPISLPAATC